MTLPTDRVYFLVCNWGADVLYAGTRERFDCIDEGGAFPVIVKYEDACRMVEKKLLPLEYLDPQEERS